LIWLKKTVNVKSIGRVDDFKTFVKEVLGLNGSWNYFENSGGFHCFKSSIVTLSFYPSTKTIQFQGGKSCIVKTKIVDIITSKSNSTIDLDSTDVSSTQEMEMETLIDDSDDDEDDFSLTDYRNMDDTSTCKSPAISHCQC